MGGMHHLEISMVVGDPPKFDGLFRGKSPSKMDKNLWSVSDGSSGLGPVPGGTLPQDTSQS